MSIKNNLQDYLKSIADAIRSAENTSDEINAQDFPERILKLGGEDIKFPSININCLTGATIPITYKNNQHEHENIYEYTSDFDITITGLSDDANIIGNGTKNVIVEFDVSSSNSKIKNFNISMSNGRNYIGIYAHYPVEVTGILVFYFDHVSNPEYEEDFDEYYFIEGNTLPTFTNDVDASYENNNVVRSYQILNTLISNHTGTTLDNNFLQYAYSFNQPFKIPPNVTSIGTSFLRYASTFNQPLEIPDAVSIIGDNFMSYCMSFNQKINIPSNIKTTGQQFMAYMYSFNQEIVFPEGLETIDNHCLSNNFAFNQPITIPSTVTTINGNFLDSNHSFNHPLIFPDNIKSIGNGSLKYLYSFNSELKLPANLEEIGQHFLSESYSFNQPVTIPPTLENIGERFMFKNYVFNYPLEFPEGLKSIGAFFLSGQMSNRHPIIIPSTVTTVGDNFLSNMNSLTTVVYNTNVYPPSANSLIGVNGGKNHATDGKGIKIYGSNRNGLMAALPNTANRKLVDGGY